MSLLEIALKLLLAVALGGIVGLERETSHKPAGFRTNVLICVGATMMMILSGLILHEQEAGGESFSRIAAGVITGIGFIGAGTIIQARGIVLGLTTAATLWAVAGLGLVIGAGYYWIAILFTALILLTLIIFGYIERHYLKRTPYSYRIKTQNAKDLVASIKKLAAHEGLKSLQLTVKKEDDFAIIDLSFQATEEKEQKYNQSLIDLAEVLEIKIE